MNLKLVASQDKVIKPKKTVSCPSCGGLTWLRVHHGTEDKPRQHKRCCIQCLAVGKVTLF